MQLNIDDKKGEEAQIVFEKSLKKYGYTLEKYEECSATSTLFSNNISLLVPYINEYTYDMIPEKPFPPKSTIEFVKTKRIDFSEMLMRRKKTLPANGFLISFNNSILFEKILMKEVYYNNTIHLLCKFSTIHGDITIRYNTKTTFICSPLNHQDHEYYKEFNEHLKQIALWLYSAYVCPNEEIFCSEKSYHCFTNDIHSQVCFSSIGGKPKITLKSKSNQHLNYDKYEQKQISIAGYIRKLPAGQKPSEDKILLAQNLGLELSSDETFVEPFTRTTWTLKIKNDI